MVLTVSLSDCADTQTYDYGEDLGVTAVALYDYQAGECIFLNLMAEHFGMHDLF